MALKPLALALCVVAGSMQPIGAQDADLRLAVPADMYENGFMKHLLPRFGFKTRIRIEPVPAGETADLAFTTGTEGKPLFTDADGTEYRFAVATDDAARLEKIAKFEDWLDSDPGKAAIEGFPPDGPSLYQLGAVTVEVVAEVELDGDIAAGSKLALQHCGRCHVVDERNPFGGIGSTPSFPALRGRIGWSDLFLAFWTENPHPSFTQVDGMTEPFDPLRPAHIAPLLLTLEDIDAITAYVGTLEPKNLGAGVAPR